MKTSTSKQITRLDLTHSLSRERLRWGVTSHLCYDSFWWFDRLFVISHHVQRSFILSSKCSTIFETTTEGVVISSLASSPSTEQKPNAKQVYANDNKTSLCHFIYIWIINNTFSLLHLFWLLWLVRQNKKHFDYFQASLILPVLCTHQHILNGCQQNSVFAKCTWLLIFSLICACRKWG